MGAIGLILLFVFVFGGFVLGGGGNAFGVFAHPGEYVVIIGAALAALIISTPMKYIGGVFKYAIKALTIKDIGKAAYLEGLKLMYELFQAQKKEGVQAIETHIEDPGNSKIFTNYPGVLGNHHLIEFVCDSMRTFISGGPSPYDMDDLLTADLEVMHEEEHHIPATIQSMADALPAIGIVAAVLGVIVTMMSISAGPEVVGGKVAAALVGTFLGIFLGYGIVGPIATRLNHYFESEGNYFKMFKSGILSNCRGLPPQVSVEFARRAIPISERPSFKELEEELKDVGNKKAA
ncbi:flagellar motor stator protein MotA [bacterium]|nr:flagellar motor stator protein MotA [bacterium]